MTLEEEKRLVLKWLGYSVGVNRYWKKEAGRVGAMSIESYHGNTDPRCWPEIWEKIDGQMIKKYIPILAEMVGGDWKCPWRIHTAPPEVCWKALIKTLKGAE